MSLPRFTRSRTLALMSTVLLGIAPAALGDAADQPGVPQEELFRDWVMQDFGLDVSMCFADKNGSSIEQKMVGRVFEELNDPPEALRRQQADLTEKGVPGSDPRWRSLYTEACLRRRANRLAIVLEKAPRIVFTRHYDIGGSHYAYTEGQSDAQAERHFQPGSALCLLEVDAQLGSVRTLLSDRYGVIRDPDVSYDGRRILFAWKKSDRLDDYHLYEMEADTGKVRQLTFGLGFADYEGVYLPNGDILFNSTRCVQTVDCWWTEVSNLYACDKDGRHLRRVSFDQVHTNYPQVLEDGRVTYTRWDYNDRGQIYPQPLFQMNADGTNQTEFYGNNSWFPTTVLHARGIPGTQKLIAVLSGHHSHQRGKLAIIDPAKGRQEASGVQLIAPVRETEAVRVDAYGQDGEQFQYPYALSATQYLITYVPVGRGNREYRRPFGVYLMTNDGRRELLAWAPETSSNQQVPLVARPRPHLRPSQVDYSKEEGVYYLQDVYAGPGLQGVPRGTIKSLRVVALDFRAAGIGANGNAGPAGGALVSTPVAVSNGTWDVKRVLGQARVYDDGSACYRVPARTPVYFQALDQQGHVVQTMRTWSTLQPGEVLSCVGCHESKSESVLYQQGVSTALRAGPQELEPFYGPARGFSFNREIQPILDRHCVRCHYDRKTLWSKIDPDRQVANPDPATLPGRDQGEIAPAFSLLGETTVDAHAKRRFSDAYLALTNVGANRRRDAFAGVSNAMVNWINVQSSPAMLPPYSAGSAKSRLFVLLRDGHYGAKLAREDLDKLACWIDLLVPYCGDYTEANAWDDAEKEKYARYHAKRKWMAEIEARNVAGMVAREPADSPGGNRGYRNLALNPDASQDKPTSYPHATSNSEHNDLPEFAARAAIDGRMDNRGHGKRFPSWGPDKRKDAWWQVDFGREVAIDRVSLVIRADFPHDAHWHAATLEFSDGSREQIRIAKTAEKQEFAVRQRVVTSMRITNLVQSEPLGWCGLTEVQVWGRDADEVRFAWELPSR